MFFSLKNPDSQFSGTPEKSRNCYLSMSDQELLDCCRVDVYIGSGPGGQHRNRNYTAVRIIFKAIPEIYAEDSTSRSQKQNIKNALQKLRISIACSWREKAADIVEYKHFNENNINYPSELAKLLDVTVESKFDHKLSALRLGLSNSGYLKELAREYTVWQQFQSARAELGLSELKLPRS